MNPTKKRKYRLVVSQTACSKEMATQALRKSKGNSNDAIALIMQMDLESERAKENEKKVNANGGLSSSSSTTPVRSSPVRRHQYTECDDDILRTYVDVYSKWYPVGGNKLWKVAEKLGILPQRTFQSMKYRYLTYSIFEGGRKDGVQTHIPWQPDGSENANLYGPIDRQYFAIGCVVPTYEPPPYELSSQHNHTLRVASSETAMRTTTKRPKTKRTKTKKRKKTATLPTATQTATKKNQSRGEKECRRVLQDFFHKPFHSCRPTFLLNPVTGRKLELDCFEESLQLAVEYNGVQHYRYVPHFHKNNLQSFQTMKYRDVMKRRLCRENGILLIEVKHTIRFDDIEEFILQEYRKKKRKKRTRGEENDDEGNER